MYGSLTKYIPSIEKADDNGEWVIDREHAGTMEDPKQMPFVTYDELAIAIEDAKYNFVNTHDEMQLTCCNDILEENGISWGIESMTNADISRLDGKRGSWLYFLGVVRAERFCDGALLAFFKDSNILRWLR